jgi:hypothetical protein
MEIGLRRIVHFNVTEHPTLEWVKQQLREATADMVPKFLIHDNDGIFGQSAYKNRPRASQSLHAIPDPCSELMGPPPKCGELISLYVLGGVQHDYRMLA